MMRSLLGVVWPAVCFGATPTLPRPPLPPAPSWTPPVAVSVPLSSGLRVVVLERHSLPLVTAAVVVQAGAAVDPPSAPGLAQAVVTMLADGGAGKRSGPELVAALDELGDELRLEPGRDDVMLTMTVLSRHLPSLLGLFGDMLVQPRFAEDEWLRTRGQLVAQILEDRAEPRLLADQQFDRALYGEGHPYGHPWRGTEASVSKLTAADLRSFWAEHYGPVTTTVILVGDVKPQEGADLVAQSFGAWKSSAAPATAPAAPPAPPSGLHRVVLIDRPGAAQSDVRVGHVGVPRASPDHAAASLVDMVLGGSFTSRLEQNLREKHGYTYNIGSRFVGRLGAGPFVIQTAVRTDVTAPALGEIMAELHRLREPISSDELRKASTLIESRLVEDFLDQRAAWQIRDLVTSSLPLGRLAEELAATHQMAPKQVAALSQRLVRPAEMTIVVVGDRAKIEAPLRALPFVKQIDLAP